MWYEFVVSNGMVYGLSEEKYNLFLYYRRCRVSVQEALNAVQAKFLYTVDTSNDSNSGLFSV